MTDKETIIALLEKARIKFSSGRAGDGGNSLFLADDVEICFFGNDDLKSIYSNYEPEEEF